MGVRVGGGYGRLFRQRRRNGGTRPAPQISSVAPLSLVEAPQTRPVEGERPGPSCSTGCGRPGTCIWEGHDGELDRVCTSCCPYCSSTKPLEHVR